MSSEETKRPEKNFDFTGAWLPGVHPLRAGGKNYTSIANLEITKNGLCGVLGYSRIATLAQKTQAKSVTNLSRAAQCVVTCPSHGLSENEHTIEFSGITQTEWADLVEAGRIDIVSITDEDTLVIDYDTSAFAAAFDAENQEDAACEIYDPVQYVLARAGIQLRSPDERRSIILVQATDATGQQSALLQQVADSEQEDVPAPREFEAAPLRVDAAGAGRGRFTQWPQKHLAYCNGQETLVYAGPEMNPAKVVISSAMTDPLVNPVDCTEALTNRLAYNGFTTRLNAAPDPYTTLLLKFDGTNGQTTTVDSSPYEHTVTRLGNAVLSSTQKKFGPTSAYLSNNYGSGWRIPTHAGFNFAADNFTLDNWVRPTQYLSVYPLTFASGYKDDNNFWLWWTVPGEYSPSYICFYAKAAGQVVADYAWMLSLAQENDLQNNWRHLEIARVGNQMKLFLHGNLLSITSETQAIGNSSMPTIDTGYLYVGNNSGQASAGLYSYLDEFRVSKGIARHTENFTPPATAYTTGGAALSIFTRRPIQAVKFYLTDLNATPDTHFTGRYWVGTDYETLDLTDETQGLSINEKSLRFASTVGKAQPRFIFGNLYFMYQFALDAGAAEISRITVDAPIQPVLDLWDGVLRPVQSFRYYKGGKWIDKTLPITEETPAGAAGNEVYVANVGGLTNSEYIDIYTTERACAFKIAMFTREVDKINTVSATLSVHRWTGSTYAEAEALVDDTAEDGKTLRKNGYVSFNPSAPGFEQKKDYEGAPMWHYRLKVSATLSAAVWIDCVQYVPAPQEFIQAYKFPFMFQNRPMLCNRLATDEPNRIDYGLTHSTEGWNGEQSSFGDGCAPLYIGGQEELTCACELYNRLGSSIYTFGLIFKPYQLYILHGFDQETFKDYPVNNKIGCPAPDTLDTFTIASSQESQSARAIACWLSFNGPYLFDAGGLSPIPGIECYFDERDPRCVNFAHIHKSKGWFGSGMKYNLQIPSGANATENNTWLVFDFEVNKWYLKIPNVTYAPYFSAVVRVADQHEKNYLYGFRPNGAVMRLEHTTTYDGAPIAQHVETGEILGADNIWDIIKPQMLKLIALATDEPDVEITVTIYKDGSDTGQIVMRVPLTAAVADRIIRQTDRINPGDCASFRVRFATQTQASPKGMQLMAWAYKLSQERTDNR